MLPTEYQRLIHLSKYARWDETKKRRETWEETVARYFGFWRARTAPGRGYPEALDECQEAVLNLEVMPSMRALMTAGKALARDNVAGYNCAYLAIDNPKCFDEAMYVLMCGTGVGFSVERQFVNELPEVAETFYPTDTTIHVVDSKIGWASAYRELISLLYQGKIPKWDVSRVRAKGARLKTFGGRASGPGPLVDLFGFTITIFKQAKGRKLNSLECHDLMCKIGDVVVVGGVRRSALISLSNLTDLRMRGAKEGQWGTENPQRALSNNSVCYTETPDVGVFMDEWVSLYKSKCGERGVFNRVAAKKQLPARRDPEHEFGCNPCSEIILRPKQFCNLSEVVVRPTDTMDDLKRKVRLATILGTLQATLTDFRYLSSAWKKNTEEERLLGVSLTGIMDHPILSGNQGSGFWEKYYLEDNLEALREVAIETNREWSEKLGIPASTSITCVKPSGTVSQLVNSSSGIHPRYSRYYLRSIRVDKKDAIYEFLKASGFPNEDEKYHPSDTGVFYFPMLSPEGSVTRNERSALEQAELWKTYNDTWCEHKPSCTIYYKPEEFLELGAWVFKNFDSISGLSFLPHTDHVHEQAPYSEISEVQYKEYLEKMPKDVDWTRLGEFEKEDTTSGSQEYACSAAGGCEV